MKEFSIKKLLVSLAIVIPCFTYGNSTIIVNYTRFDGYIGQYNIPTIAIGYELSKNHLSLIPEARYGSGGNSYANNLEFEQYLSFSIKGQWNYDSGLYLFLYPSYSKLTFETSSSSNYSCFMCDEKISSWEVGLGGGIGFKFIDSIAIESSFEKSGDYDFFSLGLRYNF